MGSEKNVFHRLKKKMEIHAVQWQMFGETVFAITWEKVMYMLRL